MVTTYIRTDGRVDACGCSSAIVHVSRLFGLWRGDRGTGSASANVMTMRESGAGEEETPELHRNGL